MRIGLLADTHDRVPAIAELGRRIIDAGASMVLHAGDFCSPFSLDPFFELGITVAGVFGRNDGDPEGLRAHAARGVGVELYESPHSLEVAGKLILLVHDIAEVRPQSMAKHQFVVHGMSHQVEMKTRGETLLVNPGEACGWLRGAPSAAVLDLDSREVEIIKLDPAEWTR